LPIYTIKNMLNNKIINRFGYYSVGLESYSNKVDALIASKATGKPCDWVFNNDVFGRFDWLTPPSMGLKEVYKRRALQLREKYDYIVLNYSGGSDSHNILHTFLENNIKLDEILVRWPEKRTQDIYTPNSVVNADNHLSEWDLTLAPDLKWLAQYHPEIHIEFYDFSEESMDFFKSAESDNDPWFQKGLGVQLSPSHVVRWKTALDRYKRMFHDKGIRGCHLFGIDKPRMCCHNGNFFVFYLDSVAGIVIQFDNYEDSFSASELFYWTPDMPEVVKVQTHHIMNHIKKNPDLLPMVSPDASKSYMMRNRYESMVRNIIYPYWQKDRFQAMKPSSTLWCELDNWMYEESNVDSKVLNSWQYSIDYMEQNIDPKHILKDHTGKSDGLVGMLTPFYKIGELAK